MIALPARYADLAWPDFAQLDPARTVVLFPVGAIEQHGPHLPLSVDALLVEALAEAALARAEPGLPLLVLPTCPFGKSDEHRDYPGTLTLSASTLEALWSEIGASVARTGLRKLLILNGHGGQVATAQLVARALRIGHGLFVAQCLWPQLGLPDGVLPEAELRFGIHGGALETADLARAAFESIAFQIKDALDALQRDAGVPLGVLHADGGPTASQFLMQLTADLTGAELHVATMPDCSALGAVLAGQHGLGLHRGAENPASMPPAENVYQPSRAPEAIARLCAHWHHAVRQTLLPST